MKVVETTCYHVMKINKVNTLKYCHRIARVGSPWSKNMIKAVMKEVMRNHKRTARHMARFSMWVWPQWKCSSETISNFLPTDIKEIIPQTCQKAKYWQSKDSQQFEEFVFF